MNSLSSLKNSSLLTPLSPVSTLNKVDTALLLIIVGLFTAGLLALFSSYYHFSSSNQAKGLYYHTSRQVLWAMVGLFAMVIFARLKLELLYHYIIIICIIVIALNIIPATGKFGELRGGNRWILLGPFSFQPSELAKLTLALYLSRVLFRKTDHLDTNFISTFQPVLVVVALCIPIYLQTNFSTIVFLFGMAIVIFFVGGVALRYIFLEVGLLIGGAGALLFAFRNYRIERLKSWLNPEADPLGIGWQARMAKAAIEEGGLLGVGLGNGTYKLGRISMPSSDYIFAVIAEETGIVGCLAVMALFVAFLVRSCQLAGRFDKGYEYNLMLSLALLIVAQAFINIAVVVGIFPVTGIPLPFFSAGGSSLLTTMMMCGIMLNLSRGVRVINDKFHL